MVPKAMEMESSRNNTNRREQEGMSGKKNYVRVMRQKEGMISKRKPSTMLNTTGSG